MAADLSLDALPYEGRLLADWLVDGKAELGWRGDRRLELRMGVLTAAKNGLRKGRYYRKGDVVARRFEVWRHNEDGTDTEIINRKLQDWHTIIPELCRMDPRSPGFKSTHDVVLEDSAAREREQSRVFADAYGQHLDHLWRLVDERENGRHTTRQVPGRDPERQM